LWKGSSYKSPQDWVFPNPRWPTESAAGHPPAPLEIGGVTAEIGQIGWQTFRHSYSTMLRGVGTDIKVQQELLRHATVQSTMNIYTQAVSQQKRIANSLVVGVLFNEIAPAA